MAWTAPRTWVAGEVVTAALLNTHLRDNLLSLDLHGHAGGSGDGTVLTGVIKAFGVLTPNLEAGAYNITTGTLIASGTFRVTWSTAFSSTAYVVLADRYGSDSPIGLTVRVDDRSVSTCVITMMSSGGTGTGTSLMVMAIGTR